jgi:hypothetical protein
MAGSLIASNRKVFAPMAAVDHYSPLLYSARMALLRSIFWVALFLFFTFCFIVFFEYGSRDFTTGFKKEYERVKSFVVAQASKAPAEKKKPAK